MEQKVNSTISAPTDTELSNGKRNGLIQLGLLILVVQILFWGLLYAPWAPGAPTKEITPITFDQFELAELLTPSPAAADAAKYKPIELPYTDCCDAAYLALRGNFTLNTIPAEGLGLIAFQQVDNFIIRVNGAIVHQIGGMEFGRQTFHGQRPYLVRIPAAMLMPGINSLSFITVRDGFPYSDLYPPKIGPYDQVRNATAKRFWQMIDYRVLGGWLTFLLGLFAAIMWARARNRRFAAWLMALCWSWTAFATYGLYFDLPFGGTGRMIAFFIINTAAASSLLGFIDAWTERPVPWLQETVLAIYAAFNLLCGLSLALRPMPEGFDLPNHAWTWLSFAMGVAVVVRLLWHFIHETERRRLEAALLSVCAVCLALDGIGERFGLLAGGYLMDAAPLLLLAFMVAFLHRNFTLFQSAVDLNNLLEQTVKAREVELAVAYKRERDLVGREARSEERRRIMRDMHDGVGSQLVSLLLAVRRGAIDQARIVAGLQAVMDEIRLMIESVDSTGTSLDSMLALFEARVRPRVEEAGFLFGWEKNVTEMPDPSPQHVLHLFRMMQEGVTNALKHSGGDHIEVRVTNAGAERLAISIIDNGKGLASGPALGHGLANMRTRTEAIGGTLLMEDANPGLRLVIQLSVPAILRAAA